MTIQTLFDIELPIIQAPMAGVQGSALAVAVSNAGGLGSLPCALLSLDTARNELLAMQAQTTKPFNVNSLHQRTDSSRFDINMLRAISALTGSPKA